MTGSPPTTQDTRRRGVALLLTLAALVVVVTAMATLMRLATAEALVRETRARSAQAESLLRAAEAPIFHWLAKESHRAILPPSAAAPAIPVLNDSWSSDRDRSHLQITAFDQRAIPASSMLGPGSPMRAVVPPETLEKIDTARTEVWRDGPGLDLLCWPDAPSPYPAHAGTPKVPFTPSVAAPTAFHPKDREAQAAGLWLATHNPPPTDAGSRRRRRSPPAINVSTANIDVVEQALRMAGRAGLEVIIDARSRGKKPAISSQPMGEPHPGAPVIVTVSDVWSFRIDARVGPVTRAQWLVYARRDTGWRLIQRLELER